MYFFDYLDEMDYYVADNTAKLGAINFYRIKLMFLCTLFISALCLSLDYIINDEFHLNVFHVLFPFFMGILHKVTKIIENLLLHPKQPKSKDAKQKIRLTMSFNFTRVFAIFAFALLFFFTGMTDFLTRKDAAVLFFPIIMIATTVFYIDYFRVSTTYRLIVCGVFLAADWFVRTPSLFIADLVLVVAAFFTSTICYFVILSLQTDTGRISRELYTKSSTDLLTGLLNKISFETEVKEFLSHRRSDTECALFIFDFDNFKHINDNYGHQTGDEVIKFFGYVLHRSFRNNDIVGRIGGDEFMVLLTNTVDKSFFKDRCSDILHELRVAEVGQAKSFSASIGIALDTEGDATFDDLYSTADRALYQAKENGKACFVLQNVVKQENE